MFLWHQKTFMPIFKQRGFCFCFVFDQDSTMVIDFSNLDVPHPRHLDSHYTIYYIYIPVEKLWISDTLNKYEKFLVQPKIFLEKFFEGAWLSIWRPSLYTYGGICHSKAISRFLKFAISKYWPRSNDTVTVNYDFLCPSEVRILN